MLNYFLQNIVIELEKNKYFESFDATWKCYDRKVYIQGEELNEYIMDIIIAVDTGNWFKETISFTVSLNSQNNFVEIERHPYVGRIKYNRKSSRDISKYIVSEVVKFQSKSTGNLMEKNNVII